MLNKAKQTLSLKIKDLKKNAITYGTMLIMMGSTLFVSPVFADASAALSKGSELFIKFVVAICIIVGVIMLVWGFYEVATADEDGPAKSKGQKKIASAMAAFVMGAIIGANQSTITDLITSAID